MRRVRQPDIRLSHLPLLEIQMQSIRETIGSRSETTIMVKQAVTEMIGFASGSLGF